MVFDFETYEQNQTIRVRVEDQHGAYFESNMTVSLLNIVEDLDGDGIEITMTWMMMETAGSCGDCHPSDPSDAGSVANLPPDHLWVAGNSNLSIAENEANGSVVEFCLLVIRMPTQHFLFRLLKEMDQREITILLWKPTALYELLFV